MTIVQELSHYLRSHPDACDTPEGIAHWWTGDAGPAPVSLVETALAWMADCGVVESLTAADGRVRIRRARGDVDARLDAMAANPQATLPPLGPTQRQRGMH